MKKEYVLSHGVITEVQDGGYRSNNTPTLDSLVQQFAERSDLPDLQVKAPESRKDFKLDIEVFCELHKTCDSFDETSVFQSWTPELFSLFSGNVLELPFLDVVGYDVKIWATCSRKTDCNIVGQKVCTLSLKRINSSVVDHNTSTPQYDWFVEMLDLATASEIIEICARIGKINIGKATHAQTTDFILL